jgi:hypothetical protein
MIRPRFNKVLLVAPDVFPNQLLTDYSHVEHVSSVKSIFPSIYALAPELIILDFDFMGNDIEKVLRRIKVNRFYDRIKIHCYKSQPNDKIDDLLKTLGVDQFIYSEDLRSDKKGKTTMSSVNAIFDASLLKWTSSVAN